MSILADVSPVQMGILVVVLIILIIFFAIVSQFLGLYIRALSSGAHVSFVELAGMRLRKVRAMTIVTSRIQAMRAGLRISQAEMESHMLAGGDVERVILAMIAATKASIDLSWQ